MTKSNDIIRIQELYHKTKCVRSINSVEEFVFSQNDKYLDAFDSIPVFNPLSLLGKVYRMDKGHFFIDNKEVKDINGEKPWIAITKRKSTYNINYIDGIREKLQYPQIEFRENGINNSITQKEKCIYMRVDDFSSWERDLNPVKSKNALLIDLRNNQGGNVEKMIDFVSSFVQGEIFFLRNKQRYYRVIANKSDYYGEKQIIVLVGQRTSSSAEFCADVLRRKQKCCIIGDKTNGKWVAQTVFKSENLYVKIPQFCYAFLPDESGIRRDGIIPDFYAKTESEIRTKVEEVLNS